MNIKKKNKINKSFIHHSKNSSLIISSDLPPSTIYKILKNNEYLINQKDSRGETFLTYAIKRNKFDVVKLLLTSSILDLNFKDDFGNSYLLIATLFQRENMINPIIQKGLNLNLKNNDGNTALHLAYMLDNQNIIKILKDNKIDLSIKNNQGETAEEIKERISSPSFIQSFGSESQIIYNEKSQNSYKSDENINVITKSNSMKKIINKTRILNSIHKSNNNKNTINSNNKSDNNIDILNSINNSDDKVNIITKKDINNNINILNSMNNSDDKVNVMTKKDINNNNNILNSMNNSDDNGKIINKTDDKDNDNDNVNILNSMNKSDNINTISSIEKTNINLNSKNSFEKPKNPLNDCYNDNVNIGLSIVKPKKMEESLETCHNSKTNNTQVNIEENDSNGKIKESLGDDFFNLSLDLPKKENHDIIKIDNNINIYEDDENENENDNDDNIINLSNDNINKKSTFFKKSSSIKSINDYNNSDDDDNINIVSHSFTKKESENIDENYNPLDDNEEDNFKIVNSDDEDNKYKNQTLQLNKSIKTSDIDFNFNVSHKIPPYQYNKTEMNNNNCDSQKANTERKKITLNLNFNQPIRAEPNKLPSFTEVNPNIHNSLFNFLKRIGMEKYFENLNNMGFDDLKLIINQTKKGMGITDDNLKLAGIKLPGDRAKILIKIEEEAKLYNFKLQKEIYYTSKDLKNCENDINIQKLNKWLKEIKLEEYLFNFIDAGYHSKELLLMQMISKQPLTNNILEQEIEIKKPGHRIRIMNKLQDEANNLKKRFNFSLINDIFDTDVGKKVEQLKEECNIF